MLLLDYNLLLSFLCWLWLTALLPYEVWGILIFVQMSDSLSVWMFYSNSSRLTWLISFWWLEISSQPFCVHCMDLQKQSIQLITIIIDFVNNLYSYKKIISFQTVTQQHFTSNKNFKLTFIDKVLLIYIEYCEISH